MAMQTLAGEPPIRSPSASVPPGSPHEVQEHGPRLDEVPTPESFRVFDKPEQPLQADQTHPARRRANRTGDVFHARTNRTDASRRYRPHIVDDPGFLPSHPHPHENKVWTKCLHLAQQRELTRNRIVVLVEIAVVRT